MSVEERYPTWVQTRLIVPLSGWLGRVYFRNRTHGFEKVPADRPVIYVAKHPRSYLYLETMAFGAPIYLGDRRHFRVLEKRDTSVHRLPFLGWLRRHVGGIPATEEAALAALARGESLLIFPGGGRELYGRPDELDWRGRTGFALLAARAQVPVIPVAMVGADQQHPLRLSLGRDRSLWLPLLPLPVPLDIWFGDPIEPPPTHGEAEVAGLAAIIQKATAALLARGLEERRPFWSLR